VKLNELKDADYEVYDYFSPIYMCDLDERLGDDDNYIDADTVTAKDIDRFRVIKVTSPEDNTNIKIAEVRLFAGFERGFNEDNPWRAVLQYSGRAELYADFVISLEFAKTSHDLYKIVDCWLEDMFPCP